MLDWPAYKAGDEKTGVVMLLVGGEN
jgi:hypothetical protein